MTKKNQVGLLSVTLLLVPAMAGTGCYDELLPDDDDALMDDDARVDDAGTPDATGPVYDAAVAPLSDTFGLTSKARLIAFERASGQVARALDLALPTGETILGGDIRPADGSAILLSSAGKLYTVDLAAGSLTLKSTLRADPADASDAFYTLTGTRFGVDFNPVPDRLRIVSDQGQNLRVNVDTGLVTTDGTLNPATPGISAAAYTNSFASACRTSLFTIDVVGRKLLLQNPPNDGRLTPVGDLGDAVMGDVDGFEIVTDASGKNSGLVSIDGAMGAQVANVDLTLGTLSQPRTVALAAGERLISIFAPPPSAAPAQAAGELLATTESGKLISFMRGSPGKLCTSTPMSGLAPNEWIVGTDTRPADARFYALTDQGRLYVVAPDTGVASLKSQLCRANDADPFTGLAGTAFAVGFNPVADRLRVVSDTGVNLRINVDDGKVTTDTPIYQTSGTPSLTALAYTNSAVGASTTTLFAIDTSADALTRIGGDPADGAPCPSWTNPNCGFSTTLFPLGIGDVGALNGFDIEASTGAALAAVTLGDAASSTLVSIDTAFSPTAPSPRAAASSLGTVGGGARVRSLSFAPPATR